jgi:pimeloyl-ACP methyl ester carboxylesterase
MAFAATTPRAALAHGSTALEGFVAVNGVRLQYLDWGGAGPALILIHGLADNPHVFDDLALELTDRFHVMAYARRGSGSSDTQGPYDVATLTDDLRGFMNALGVARADLVSVSAGGEEMTRVAAESPERVGRIVYLEAGYDFASPHFRSAVEARPFKAFAQPPSARASFEAYSSYIREMWYPGLQDMRRMEANLRSKLVIQPDGSVQDRAPKALVDALYAALWTNEPRDYARVRCPVLAIYAEHYYDVGAMAGERRDQALSYERAQWDPFRARSIEHLRRDLPGAQIAHVRGGHSSFILMSRQEVVRTLRRFLEDPSR